MKARKHAQLSTSHNRSQRISSLWGEEEGGGRGWKRKLKMLMSVKAPWPPFPVFPGSDLLKIRAVQCVQHKHSSWRYRIAGSLQEVRVKHQLQGLKSVVHKRTLIFCSLQSPQSGERFFFFSSLPCQSVFSLGEVWKI